MMNTENLIRDHIQSAELLFSHHDVLEAEKELGHAEAIFSGWCHIFNDEQHQEFSADMALLEGKIKEVHAFIDNL